MGRCRVLGRCKIILRRQSVTPPSLSKRYAPWTGPRHCYRQKNKSEDREQQHDLCSVEEVRAKRRTAHLVLAIEDVAFGLGKAEGGLVARKASLNQTGRALYQPTARRS